MVLRQVYASSAADKGFLQPRGFHWHVSNVLQWLETDYPVLHLLSQFHSHHKLEQLDVAVEAPVVLPRDDLGQVRGLNVRLQGHRGYEPLPVSYCC